MLKHCTFLCLLIAVRALGQDALDETARWTVAGKGAVEKGDAPAPIEGATALKCSVDEAKRGYVYFGVKSPSPDLTQFDRLRFRIYGGLERGEVHEIVIHDNKRRWAKWRTKSLNVRSREPRWTEFLIYFDAPSEARDVDLRDAKSITWRILAREGGKETKCFYLDGVRLERADMPPAPGPDEVVLAHDGYQALFSKASHFELTGIRTADGGTIPVVTDSQIVALSTAPADADTVAIGGKPSWKKVDASPDRLHVAYDSGDYRHENTFAWEGGALAVRRRVTCLRPGIWSHAARVHLVTLGKPMDRYVYDHGRRESAGLLPVRDLTQLPGYWCAGFTGKGTGAAVVFPQRPLYTCSLHGKWVQVIDRGNFSRNSLPKGAHLDYEIWIAPLKPGDPALQAQEATRSICARLTASKDPCLAYFPWRYQPRAPQASTLFNGEGFALSSVSSGAAAPAVAPPPEARAGGVALCLARGETEPIHLVIHAERPMKSVSVQCPPLRSGQNQIAKERFRVRYAGYVDIRRTTEAEQAEHPHPEWAQFVGEIQHGSTHLATDRFYGIRARTLGPVEDPLYDVPAVDVAPGRNQPIWITLAVPPETPPGRYRGEIILSEAERPLCRVPIEVTVWSFTLPKTTSLRTWYQLWQHPVTIPFWREYYRDLAEHKVSGTGSYPRRTTKNGDVVNTGPEATLENGGVSIHWSRFDEVMPYLLDELGMHYFKLPYGKRGGGHSHVYDFLGLKEGTPEFEKALHDCLCKVRQHLQEKGWMDKFGCYIFDEPDLERIEVIRRTAPIIRKAVPEVWVFPACARNNLGLIGALNAWCPPVDYLGLPYGEFNPKRVSEGRARGEAFLWYNQSDNCIGAPVVTHRALPWATWANRLDGYFVWSINYWGAQKIPWTVRYEIGEANALYPGKKGPVDSLRWEMTREGLEDYDYLVMLEKALAKPNVPKDLAERGRAVLEQAKGLFPDPRRQIGVHPDVLKNVRDEIGRILNALSE